MTNESIAAALREMYGYENDEAQIYTVTEGDISRNDLLAVETTLSDGSRIILREFGTTIKRPDGSYFRGGEVVFQRCASQSSDVVFFEGLPEVEPFIKRAA